MRPNNAEFSVISASSRDKGPLTGQFTILLSVEGKENNFLCVFFGPQPCNMEIPRLRVPTGAIATSLCHSHSNTGS